MKAREMDLALTSVQYNLLSMLSKSIALMEEMFFLLSSESKLQQIHNIHIPDKKKKKKLSDLHGFLNTSDRNSNIVAGQQRNASDIFFPRVKQKGLRHHADLTILGQFITCKNIKIPIKSLLMGTRKFYMKCSHKKLKSLYCYIQ